MTPSTIKTRFVIFAGARSGSTALTITLNSHPDVYCHGHPFFQNHKRVSALRAPAEDVIDLAKRESEPVGYVYDVLNYTPGPSVVGFKIWRGDHHGGQKAIDALAADPRIKKIILNRSNVLACQSSEALVHLKQKDPAVFEGGARPKLDFDPMVLLKFTQYRAQIFQGYHKQIKGDVLEVPYVGLMETGISQIADFLGLAPFTFKARTQKRNTSDILGRYKAEHHDTIRLTLERIGHPEWVAED